MKFSSLVVFVALFTLTIPVACSGPKKPNDLPKLYPCTVSINMNGTPLEGALVSLVPEAGKWSASGTTGAAGSVELFTRNFPGVPEGSYRVTVQKIQATGSSTADEENRAVRSPQGELPPPPSLVDPKFADSMESPLECKVEAGKNAFEFSVNPPK